MTILARVSRLFRADFHAVLDNIEEPDVLLRQAVREMEEELAAGNESIRTCKYELEQINKRIISSETLLKQHSGEIDLCLAAGNIPLAKNFVRRKLEASTLVKSLLEAREKLTNNLAEQNRLQQENTSKYQSMKQKSDLLWQEQALRKAESAGSVCQPSSSTVQEDDVEIAFMKEMQRFKDSAAGSKVAEKLRKQTETGR